MLFLPSQLLKILIILLLLPTVYTTTQIESLEINPNPKTKLTAQIFNYLTKTDVDKITISDEGFFRILPQKQMILDNSRMSNRNVSHQTTFSTTCHTTTESSTWIEMVKPMEKTKASDQPNERDDSSPDELLVADLDNWNPALINSVNTDGSGYTDDTTTGQSETTTSISIASEITTANSETSEATTTVTVDPSATTDSTTTVTVDSSATTESITTATADLSATTVSTSTTSSTSTTTVLTFGNSNTVFGSKPDFTIVIDCANLNATAIALREQFCKNSPMINSSICFDASIPECNGSSKVNLGVSFPVVSNPDDLTELYETLLDIAKSNNGDLFDNNQCGLGNKVNVLSVDSCYLINACLLCQGEDGRRGICEPSKNVTKCECFINPENLATSYYGDFCEQRGTEPVDSSFRHSSIVVGILSGFAGIFVAISCCLVAALLWRRRPREELAIRRVWNLPRANPPNAVSAENAERYLNDTISTMSSKTLSSVQDKTGTFSRAFFDDLDKRIATNNVTPNENLNESIDDSIAALSAQEFVKDPIEELDAIIDQEDVSAIFHDALDQSLTDEEEFGIFNPNLSIARVPLNFTDGNSTAF